MLVLQVDEIANQYCCDDYGTRVLGSGVEIGMDDCQFDEPSPPVHPPAESAYSLRHSAPSATIVPALCP